MKRLPVTARGAYQERRFYALWGYTFRGLPNGRRYAIRARRHLWRRWEAKHGATHQVSAAWWLRMSSRQMLHGLQCHWTFPYTMWMVKLCGQEHQED